MVIWRSPASSLGIHPPPSNGFDGRLGALIGSCLPAAPSSPRMRVNSHPANPPDHHSLPCLHRRSSPPPPGLIGRTRGESAHFPPTPGTVRSRLRTAVHPYCSIPLRTLRNTRVVPLSSIESSYIVHGNVRRLGPGDTKVGFGCKPGINCVGVPALPLEMHGPHADHPRGEEE